MTSKLTIAREQAELRAFIIGFLTNPMHDNQSENSMTAKVFRMALAAMDSEPVYQYRIRNGYNGQVTEWQNIRRDQVDFVIKAQPLNAEFRIIAAPQPAPLVSFYRDGIEAAAKWIDQQREAYGTEHGWSDPDTGAFEFGNDAQREYSSTLEELAEGIRALHPNVGNSPVIPDGYVMVPMRLTAENGAKGALAGEFSETKFVNCSECFGDDECETCDGSGRIEITVPGSWTNIKEIWAKGVEHFAAAPQEVQGE
ncbi:TPA: DUF550 domain-containing protein [Klebsiella pneumoniae]